MWNSLSSLTEQFKDAINEAPGGGSEDEEDEDEEYENDTDNNESVKEHNEKASYLNAALNAQKAEAERYKRELEDVSERLRISETQNMEVSKEYRRLLIEKEEELKSFKAEHSKLEAQLGKKEGTKSLDLDSELEIKTLSSLVEQYKREKEALQQQLANGAHSPSNTNKEKEVSAKHQEKMNSLKAYYEEQLQDLRGQLSAVDSSQQRTDTAGDVGKATEALKEERDTLLQEKQQVRELLLSLNLNHYSDSSDVVGMVQSMATQLTQSQHNEESNTEVQTQLQQSQQKIEMLTQINDRLKNELEHVNVHKVKIEKELRDVKESVEKKAVEEEQSASRKSVDSASQQQLEKAQKDLMRLRQHLLEMEESHTLAEVEASDRIAALEGKLHEYEKRETIHSKRDNQFEDLKSELREKEDELARTTTALTNLQTVIELFQANQEDTIAQETKEIRMEINNIKEECDKLRKENAELRDAQKRCNEAEAKVKSLYEEITEKTRAYIKLQEEFTPLRQALDHTLAKLADMSQNEQNQVDKRVVNQLLMKYFVPGANKTEVLALIARMLNFTDEQKQYVGLTQPKGWLGFLKGSGSVAPGSSIIREERSITEMWMEFLTKESEKGTNKDINSISDSNINSNSSSSSTNDNG